jgi:GH15 family glucan-1,4-alpha-glucosidase
MAESDLELGVIGNCVINALIDRDGSIVWCCMPRFDGDPVFCQLLAGGGELEGDGAFAVDLENQVDSQQHYIENTAVLITTLTDADGQSLEIVDFAPRFNQFGRRYRPIALTRIIRPVKGAPRIRIRLRPLFDYGATKPQTTHGSNHIRYVGPDFAMRLTTDAPISYLLNGTSFHLEEPISMFLGPDESFSRSVREAASDFLGNTIAYWREWVRHLAVPLDYQDAVIRAAITLKMCWFEETGAIIAAMTTSIPESAHSARNWDYRFCWLRDAYFVVRALNRLGAVDIMEGYLRYLRNLTDFGEDIHLQPVYGIGLESSLTEREVTSLSGYRGMGPVRVGNQAYEHKQHDVYGQVILSNAQAFFDRRLLRQLTQQDFAQLEKIGDRAFALHDQPDAGLWELRTISKVHTYSSLMCWTACDRLAKIAQHLDLSERASHWRARARQIHDVITDRAWEADKGMFSDAFGGGDPDASLLLMPELGFLPPNDPRIESTVEKLEEKLLKGSFMFRYAAPDDFGEPENAFNICTFWYIEALALMGRTDEARAIFGAMLECRNRSGLLSEDIDPKSRELWGNYPQTYSLVGIINSAIRLSRSWEDAV